MTASKIIAETKLRIERGYSYVSILGMGIVIINAINNLWPFNAIQFRFKFLVEYICAVILIYGIGFIDTKSNLFKDYNTAANKLNPHIEEMHKRIMRKSK